VAITDSVWVIDLFLRILDVRETQNNALAFTILNDLSRLFSHDKVGSKGREASRRFEDSEETHQKDRRASAGYQKEQKDH
jgi:hypothetical protein